MKKIIFAGMALVATLFVNAQKGTVIYNETMKLEIHLDGDAAGMESMLPKERKVIHELFFSPEASLYQNCKQSDEQEVKDEMSDNGGMVVKMEVPDDKLYIDMQKQESTEQRDFMSRTFLIQSKLDTLPWKLTGNRREILGCQCLEAGYIKDSVETLAWFAPSIPVSTGPGSYRGLPGLILEVNVNHGKRIITASSITEGDVTALIVKPKKGKKTTKEEFRKMVEEKTGGQGGSEGKAVFMIKIDK